MLRPAVIALCAACVGCAAGPERVFEDSTYAFAEGDVARGARHFSERLLAARPVKALEAYYLDPDHRKGVAFLLREHRFRVLREDAGRAVAEVTWTTGRTEEVRFVREGGEWKIDAPPEADSAEAPSDVPAPRD